MDQAHHAAGGRAMKDWKDGEIRWIALDSIGERYRRYRLPDAAAEMAAETTGQSEATR